MTYQFGGRAAQMRLGAVDGLVRVLDGAAPVLTVGVWLVAGLFAIYLARDKRLRPADLNG